MMALEALTFFVLAPLITVAIGYAAWRGKFPTVNLGQYVIACVASGITGLVLVCFAKWLNADVRTAQYLVQVACFLIGFLLLGVSTGCFVPVLLHLWRWHRLTRLTDGTHAKR